MTSRYLNKKTIDIFSLVHQPIGERLMVKTNSSVAASNQVFINLFDNFSSLVLPISKFQNCFKFIHGRRSV